jgi:penicillin amidase
MDRIRQPDGLPQSSTRRKASSQPQNEKNFPSDFSVVERKIGYEWTDPSRATRIEEVLAASQILLLRMRWRCKTMNIP